MLSVKKVVRLFSLAFLFLYLAAGIKVNVNAQQLDSDQVKVAYIFNFIKHIHWPASEGKSSIILAVYDDAGFYRVLKKALEKRRVNGKAISVISVKTAKAARTAELLFIPFHHGERVSLLASETRRSGTLLVTDRSKNKHDIMINLIYNSATSAISFEVNKSNIIYEQLEMSAELLLLGGTELDVATLYRETELAMQNTRKRELELNQKLAQQQEKLDDSSKKLTRLNNELKRSSQEISKQKQALTRLETDIESQRQAIIEKEKQLTEVTGLLDDSEKELISQQNAITAKEIENREMAQRVEDNRVILQQQQQSIAQQGVQLEQQGEELDIREEKIIQQQTTIWIISILIVISVLVSVLVVILFFKNRRTTAKLSQTLSHLENTQDQLIQSEKMASLGTLTAGVAHEINTPLGIIVTSISLMIEKTHEIKKDFASGALRKSAMARYFDSVEQSSDMSNKALERVITLLGNFKQVAADQVVEEAREINLAEYIEEVMNTLSAEIKRSKVNYHYTGEAELCLTTIPGIFAQILTNLVTNAIKHGFEHKENGNINIHVRPWNGGAKIVFMDDGCGMTQEVINKIYDPFFTTKRSHGGTGLGMNIVYNLINKKLEGHIEIDSELGTGTTVTITLPKSIEAKPF